jgi:hypothetical protein
VLLHSGGDRRLGQQRQHHQQLANVVIRGPKQKLIKVQLRTNNTKTRAACGTALHSGRARYARET